MKKEQFYLLDGIETRMIHLVNEVLPNIRKSYGLKPMTEIEGKRLLADDEVSLPLNELLNIAYVRGAIAELFTLLTHIPNSKAFMYHEDSLEEREENYSKYLGLVGEEE